MGEMAWNYTEVTRAAEERIRRLMKSGCRHQRQWAYGVYIFWDVLTMGWQKDGDAERLERMTTEGTEHEASNASDHR